MATADDCDYPLYPGDRRGGGGKNMMYVIRVRSEHLTPPDGVLEIEADDFVEAAMKLATKMPGIELVELVMEYNPEDLGSA